jgi:endonuclease/exonuclease/phosphatase family metal-dependent hydrolase
MSAPLRILSFNIHGGYSLDGRRDLQRVHRLLEDLNIDIAVFQEMETRPSRGGTATDVNELAGAARPYHMMGPTLKEGLGWYGNLIVSRYPFRRALVHSLEKKWDKIEPRNAVDVLIETPLGNMRLLGTHLSLPAWERRIEVPKLIELVKQVEEEEKNPVFLMGDINEWRRSSRLLRFLGEQMILIEAGATFPVFFPILHLDRAWHDTPHVRAKATVIKDHGVRNMSDHLPILIEVENLKAR